MKLRHTNALAILAAFAVTAALPTTGHAVSHVTKFSAPLTQAYSPCSTDKDTTSYCDAAGDIILLSPWEFSQGTVVIEDGQVGLRLDDLHLRSGLTCTAEFGSTAACHCHDSNDIGDDCDDDGDCTGTDSCGPNGRSSNDNNYFTVNIYQQGYIPAQFGIPTTRVRRTPSCHQSVDFDIKNSSGNRNRQVNESVTVSTTSCNGPADPDAEIRAIEVVDKHGNLVAVAAVE